MRVVGRVAAVAAVVVAVGTVLVAAGVGSGVDHRLSDAAIAASRRHAWVLATARAVTQLGAPVTVDVVCVLAAAVLAWRRRWRAVVVVALARLVSLGLEQALKYGVDRARPDPVPALAHAGGPSFPSGHSTGIAVVAVLVIIAVRRATATALLVVIACAVAASRVFLGVHYPTDVVAGLALGTAVTCASALLAHRLPPISRRS